MSNRHDFYFKQPVSESELDDGFSELENADRALMTDQALVGIFSGGAVAQHSPVANLTVDVGGPMYGYDDFGQRIYIPGPSINVNVAQDSSSVSTSVAGGGNEKWVSIAAKFTRVLSDPRTDGNSATVYFRRDESYQIVVTQGTEAAIGTAARPALDPDALLLADVNRRNGQTQIFNASINIDRRQDVFVFAGPMGGQSIRSGTIGGAVSAMLTALNNHILTLGSAHPANAIDYASGPAWADGATNPSTDVESQLDKIVSDLVLTTASHSGGHKVGLAARTSWTTGTSPTNPSTNIFAGIDKIITDLSAQAAGSSGASRLGCPAVTDSPGSLVAGNLEAQLVDLLSKVNARALIASTEHITGSWTFDDVVSIGIHAGTIDTRVQTGTMIGFDGSDSTDPGTGGRLQNGESFSGVALVNGSGSNFSMGFQALDLPNGSTLNTVIVQMSGGSNPPTTKWRAKVFKTTLAGAATQIGGTATDAAAGGGYTAPHTFSVVSIAEVIDRSTYRYSVEVLGEIGGTAPFSFLGAKTICALAAVDLGAG